MCQIKKAYVDSRFRTRNSNSDSDFNFESKEALDLPDNAVCYQIMLFVMSMTFQFRIHGAPMHLITTSFI